VSKGEKTFQKKFQILNFENLEYKNRNFEIF